MRDVQNVTERAKGRGQTVRQRHDHGVLDLIDRYVNTLVVQDGAIKCAVVDDHPVDVVDDPLQRLAPVGQVLRVPDLRGLVVDGKRHQQHFGRFGVLVRAVLDRRLAVGFKVEVEGGHNKSHPSPTIDAMRFGTSAA